MTESRTWWLVGNRAWGVRAIQAPTGRDAKRYVREGMVESFMGEGYSRSASERGASSYRVFVIAGGLTQDEAESALEAWDADDCEPAMELSRRYRNGLARAARQRRTSSGSVQRSGRGAGA